MQTTFKGVYKANLIQDIETLYKGKIKDDAATQSSVHNLGVLEHIN